jgi:hypothetical protein
MRSAAREEIEYVGSIDDEGRQNPTLIDEMWHQLEALRCYDQRISAGDWRPHHGHGPWGSSNLDSRSLK